MLRFAQHDIIGPRYAIYFGYVTPAADERPEGCLGLIVTDGSPGGDDEDE